MLSLFVENSKEPVTLERLGIRFTAKILALLAKIIFTILQMILEKGTKFPRCFHDFFVRCMLIFINDIFLSFSILCNCLSSFSYSPINFVSRVKISSLSSVGQNISPTD